MGFQRLIRVLALAAALAAASSVSATAAWATTFGGFSVRPAHFDPSNPATRAYFIVSAKPGQTVHDAVVVTNTGTSAIELRVYGADGLTGVTSGAVYSNAQVPLRKAGRWVVAQENLIALAKGQSTTVPFSVAVPAGTSPGDHLAGIALQNARPQKTPGRFSITEVLRTVVGILVEVPGPAHAQATLSGISLQALAGTKVPAAVVELGNSGLKLCKPILAVTLSTSKGLKSAVTQHLDTVLPGDTIPYPLAWPHALQAGTYPASATASGCGAPVTFRTVAHLGGELAGTKTNPNAIGIKTGAGSSSSAAIAAAGIGLLLLALTGLFFFLILRRRRRRWEQEPRPLGS